MLNAIPGRDTTEDHYGGDEPADRMQEAVDAIIAAYRREWGRPPYIEELDGVWKFISSKYRRAGGVVEYEAGEAGEKQAG